MVILRKMILEIKKKREINGAMYYTTIFTLISPDWNKNKEEKKEQDKEERKKEKQREKDLNDVRIKSFRSSAECHQRDDTLSCIYSVEYDDRQLKCIIMNM